MNTIGNRSLIKDKSSIPPTLIVPDRGVHHLASVHPPAETVKLNTSTKFEFSTCGATGATGPSQNHCDTAYKHTKSKVSVIADGMYKGIQSWSVPATGNYSILAKGASGGAGVKTPAKGRGRSVYAQLSLRQGDTIYMLVGQEGQSACTGMMDTGTLVGSICNGEIPDSLDRKKFLTNSNGSNYAGGGGGGGGATFIFKLKDMKPIPLLVAAGGGGMSYRSGAGATHQLNGLGFLNTSSGLAGRNGNMLKDGPGAGGGWDGKTNSTSTGRSLIDGSQGGEACALAMKKLTWNTKGGYGGGGGACMAGGSGGGYRGGDAQVNDIENDGRGGWSYATPHALDSNDRFSLNTGPGAVIITYVTPHGCICPVGAMCILTSGTDYECHCPMNQLVSANKVCVDDPVVTAQNGGPPAQQHMIIIVICSLTAFLVSCVGVFCAVYRHKQKQLRKKVRQEMMNNPEFQLNRLRQGAGMLTEYNPNYEFGGGVCTLQDLTEIPRENLTLVKALGQGAFGEVYQGLLLHVPGEPPDLPVAVKTLPELSTDQAEMDFLMEALIMCKFNHPNIVRFIGVCFEKHPRFIILELLNGGDLKSFMRECRPKPDQPSPLSMLDLVKLSLDVAYGCQYLEDNHFIHRDLAARNCLLTTKGTGRNAKIADFGMARDIYRADYYRKGGKAMLPVKWMPPEAFLDGVFTSKTDVWSFGVLLWEVFSLGYMPYPGRGNQEVMQLVTAGGRLEPPSNCPSQIYSIMVQCWAANPEDRPNFVKIISTLQQLAQEPGLVHAPLPVFYCPPCVEREATLTRAADDVCLQVQRPATLDALTSPTLADGLLSQDELKACGSVDELNRLLHSNPYEVPRDTASPVKQKTVRSLSGNNSSSRGYTSVPTNEPMCEEADTLSDNLYQNPSYQHHRTSSLGSASSGDVGASRSPSSTISRNKYNLKNAPSGGGGGGGVVSNRSLDQTSSSRSGGSADLAANENALLGVAYHSNRDVSPAKVPPPQYENISVKKDVPMSMWNGNHAANGQVPTIHTTEI
ncbi:PREDICTED: ALK tyrosine kinase receptor-like [Priapulus caudatus]|uniref:Tyrosine-protein kinase receptor n=1 Tax=Priapulus caudatus TaxID=37621 RepID=A0ABM1ENH2_PRICU|nr:PREDICTED: ALK tyrosine kinase receptor-like [Priapulus caudatus]